MNKRKFERDADNRIIGGVCGGLARYFGVSSRIVRFLFFFSIFVSFSMSFWIYLILWVFVPLRRSTRENLSRDLRKKARNLDRLFDEARSRLNLPGLSDRLSNVQELIENMLPDLDNRPRNALPELSDLREAVFVHLPDLLENFLRLPAGYARNEALSGRKTAQDHFAEELSKLEKSLINATRQRYGEKFSRTVDALDTLQTRFEDDPTAPIRLKLESLQSRVAGRLDEQAEAKIEAIKQLLLAALGRLLQAGDETDQNLYNVRQIALEYLPETLDKYLALPSRLAGSEPLAQGRTAQAVLHEQLDLLDESLGRMVNSLYKEDAQGLLVHGHFLRDKFLDHQIEWTKGEEKSS